MSKEMNERLDRINTTMAVEGLYLTEKEMELVKLKVTEKLTRTEFLKRAKELALK